MAEEDEGDEDELPSVDHGPLNEGPWEKYQSLMVKNCAERIYIEMVTLIIMVYINC